MKTYILNSLFLITSLLISFQITAQQQELWGIYNAYTPVESGGLYKTDTIVGNTITQIPFEYYVGQKAVSSLCEAPNGNLFGVTPQSTLNNHSVFFEYNPNTGMYKVIKSISGFRGSPICASNGKIYGMGEIGGYYNNGFVYEYDPTTEVFTLISNFSNYMQGKYAHGSLMQASNGKLYGLTKNGGSSNIGVLFEYNISTSSFTTKYSFTSSSTGMTPIGGLIQASNGKLYGCASGGTYNQGVLFEYDISSNTYTAKYSLKDNLTGAYAGESLFQASNGKLYGHASNGGAYAHGTLFEYDIAQDTIIVKINFDGTSKGSSPRGNVIQIDTNYLYGMTQSGGTYSKGVIYKYDFLLDSFTNILNLSVMMNGKYPEGSLMQTDSGRIFGMTYSGGLSYYNGEGTLFELVLPTDSFIKKFNFMEAPNGKEPTTAPFLASNGKLYGMTFKGGPNDKGVIYEYNPKTQTRTVLHQFDGYLDGRLPISSFYETTNGKLLGMTFNGGNNGKGVIFELNLSNYNYTIRYHFNSTVGLPKGKLVEANNGLLYGLTIASFGGPAAKLFAYDTTNNTVSLKQTFIQSTSGPMSDESLVYGNNGKLYGVNPEGGNQGKGTLYEYDILNDTLIDLFLFDNTNGASPRGTLTLASNGKLYGFTKLGGSYNKGVLFEYDISNDTLIKWVDFGNGQNGSYPGKSLLELNNGNLYGITKEGGTTNNGVFFKFNSQTHIYTKLENFNFHPEDGLVKVDICLPNIMSPQIVHACNSYTWTNGITYSQSNFAITDTLINIYGCDSIISLDLTIDTVDTSLSVNDPLITSNAINASYQWLDCNANYAIINNATSQTYTATQNGLYAVEVQQNSCIDTSNCVAIVHIGINKNNIFNKVQIFPNPTTSKVRINLGDLKEADVFLYNNYGQLLLTKRLVNTKDSYLFIDEAPGLYLIELIANNQHFYYKIVIQQ